jgi:putative acetyltransferase
VEALKATRVDCNEQNEQALGFYLKMGFEVIGRSELDGTNKPYPILHMRLAPR